MCDIRHKHAYITFPFQVGLRSLHTHIAGVHQLTKLNLIMALPTCNCMHQSTLHIFPLSLPRSINKKHYTFLHIYDISTLPPPFSYIPYFISLPNYTLSIYGLNTYFVTQIDNACFIKHDHENNSVMFWEDDIKKNYWNCWHCLIP